MDPGFHSLARHPDARTTPGLLLFRFNGPIVFFNAAHFKRSALAAADAAGSELHWFVLDLLPVTIMDATGLETVRELFESLRARGVEPGTAGRKGEWLEWGTQRGYQETDIPVHLFPNLRSATHAYVTAHGVASQPPPDPEP